MNYFEDKLSVLGAAVGAYLVLAGAATLVGMPWTYAGGGLVAVGQILGALAAIGIGAGLAWLVTSERA